MMNYIRHYYHQITGGRHARIKRFFLTMILVFIIWLILPLPEPLFNAGYSTVVVDEDNQILKVFLNADEQWCLPPSDRPNLPFKLKTAVLIYEDRYFYKHPGINPVSLIRAFYQNITRGEIISGASTITMQVARMRKPKKRTYLNKLREMFQALKIECRYRKDEILQMYLDHAPYGGNILGYQAAVYRYFGKIPDQLTWSEAAMLAVLPNAPGLISPTANRQKLVQKRNMLLRKLYELELIDIETFQLALLEEVPDGTVPFEDHAPHLSRRLKLRYFGEDLIVTTLRKEIQIEVSRYTARHLEYLNQFGIRNGCAIVAETSSGKVRAYVGSQKFFDENSQGQVDGVTAPRSAGSVLKPFLYALAIDDGILLPQTLIKDIPTYFDAFSPANATETFDGIVTARDALIRSLNVPAVRLLNVYGVFPFYTFLKDAGIQTLFRSADDYGLPLIIGGVEVTAWDMARLFRGLANGGVFEPMVILENSEDIGSNGTVSLVSRGSCLLTLEMLKELKRPGADYYWKKYRNQYPLAWKTGTSYGHRDAWAVGVNPEWTIAVWIGNFDGEGNKNLSGAGSAGPLLFQIFNSLPHNPELIWFEKPEMDFTDVELCAETGFLAGEQCLNKIVARAPRFMKPLRVCPFHERVFMDRENRYAVCSQCWQKGYHRTSVLVYPADVMQCLYQKGILLENMPQHNPQCPVIRKQKDLQILYPYDNAILWIPRDFNQRYQKVVFRAAERFAERKVYWYLNDKYIGTTIANHIITAHLQVGWHEVFVMDEDGNKDVRKFFVQRKES